DDRPRSCWPRAVIRSRCCGLSSTMGSRSAPSTCGSRRCTRSSFAPSAVQPRRWIWD
ncbi:uncharacterized protein METZ01_LOCUS443339, partial [marine metagenome]